MIKERKILEEYRKLLQIRYENLINELMGREADYKRYADRHHGIGSDTYTKEYIDKCNIFDSLLPLRIAVDDFSNILREIKELANE